ncbi:flagellar hook protein FlgE [Ectothiorhodospiraceae bacterium WFHF3C12]|nr:flagellar hook protein FlgE [Ectothiorhodospiraceae bacterium WFHF3C12]
MSFETSLTGLNAASADLDVTGNNIANSATTGFKYSRAEFADIFASTSSGVSANAIGQGVRLANVSQQFSQGQFDFTSNNLDMAISGNGFFRTSQGGEISYTRNGAFQLDRDGYVVDADGRHLTGFTANNAGAITGALGDLQVNTGNIDPSESTEVDITANLNAAAEDLDAAGAPAFDTADPQPEQYNFSTSTTVYDSLGTDHLGTFYFRKTGANTWDTYFQVDGNAATGPTQLQFNADGTFNQVGGGGSTAVYNQALTNGADPLNLTVDYQSLSQFGTPFAVNDLAQDGYAAGEFSSVGIERDGRMFARYSNGQSQLLGQVALTRFSSPQNLQEVGDTRWVETAAAGTPVNTAPGNSGVGTLQSGALEQSNVNLTEQLVQMITAQRNFQANSQAISTQSEITQNVLQIR